MPWPISGFLLTMNVSPFGAIRMYALSVAVDAPAFTNARTREC